MASLRFFGWGGSGSGDDSLPIIFPMPIHREDFIRSDVIAIYSKILTDTLERTHGIDEEIQPLLWDNCLMSESSKGLVTLLAEAMADKKDLFLVYDRSLKLIRQANETEQSQIRQDYEAANESPVGTYISFKNYKRTDFVRLYSAFEYCDLSSMNKMVNLSSSIEFKMSDLRGSVSLTDSAQVKSQALSIAKALGEGKDVLMDAKDMIEIPKPDTTSIKESLDFINQRRSFYLGLPESYMIGIQTGGLGSTGEQDQKAIERGLKSYFYSIVKPVLSSVFEIQVSYKSQDFRQMTQGLETLKTFALVDEELMSADEKRMIVEKLFDLSEEQ